MAVQTCSARFLTLPPSGQLLLFYLEKNLTVQIGHLESRIDNVEGRIEKLDEKIAAQSDLEATENKIGERIERMEKRILVIGTPVVAAPMILPNHLMWEPLARAQDSIRAGFFGMRVRRTLWNA